MQNNIKLLTNDQLFRLNSKYTFDVEGDNVAVIIKLTGRKTLHPLTQNFSINATVRKVTITTEAMNEWMKIGITKYSLFDVQQAINKLKLCYQKVTTNRIKEVLRFGISKVKIDE